MNGNGFTVPTGKYVVPEIPVGLGNEGLKWLCDRWVRTNRDSLGYGADGDRAFAQVLGLQVPDGGFVDSDGRNYNGTDVDGFDREGYNRHGVDREGYDRRGFDKHGFNRTGYNRNGKTREEVAAAEIAGWTEEHKAAVANLLRTNA